MRTWLLLIIATWLPDGALATIHVPADYPTIQAAINASIGDSIIVAPGTYVENLKTNSTPILLVSEAGPAATIIDGSNPSHPDSGSVIFARGSLQLYGFTITGGGLHLLAPSTIRGNWITENHVPAPSGIGGGIGVFNSVGTMRILHNRIYSNSAQYSGGAIHIGRQQVQVEDNVIYDNHVQDGTGGAVYDPPDNTIHLRNVYACNTSSSNDGNGAAWGGREFRNCTFVSNEGPEAALELGIGGRTFNSIFVFNDGGGLQCGPFASSCNDLFGNTPFDVQGSCVVIGQNGNISVDPIFDDSGDCDATFCLSPNSPLLPENSPPGCGLIGAVGVCEVLAIDTSTSPDFASGPLLARPNPLNPQTVLSFLLPESRHVELAIFDAQGRVVRNLMSETMTRGRHDVTWDGRDEAGREVASGAYIAVLKSPAARLSQKLLVLK
jgi:hypothetical protein